MSQEKSLAIYVAVFLLSIFIGVVFFVGLFNPFWCDVPVVGLFTCLTEGKTEVEKPMKEKGQGESEVPTQGIQQEVYSTEVIPTPLIEYKDLEREMDDEPDLKQFIQTLKKAIESADFQTLEGLVSDPFHMGPYGGEYADLSRLEAIEHLRELMGELKVTIDVTNEGRSLARERYVTPRGANFALLSYGWPKGSVSLLGVKKIGEVYFWTDLVLFINP